MNLAAASARLRPRIATALPFPWTLFIVAAALRLVALAIFQAGSYIAGHNGIVDPYDSVGFDRWAWYVAEHLRAGQWTDVRASQLEGTWDVGYTYLIGLEYTVAGHVPDVARVTNCLLAAFCAPAAYVAARSTSVGETVARRAGWLTAVWPLSLFWSGYDMLKDPLIWFFLAVALLALTARDWRAKIALGIVAVAGAYLARSYMGPVVAVIVVVAAALRRDWKAMVGLVAGLGVLELVLLGLGFPHAWSLASYTTAKSEALPGENAIATTDTLRSPTGIARRVIKGIPIAALGPRFALKDVLHPTIDTGMYPGLLVWIPLIPFTVLGLWRALRRADQVLWGIAFMAVTVWLVIAILYEGLAFRQREMAFAATLVLTALGLARPWPRWWWPAYAGLVVLGALVLVAREAGLVPRIV